MLPDEHPHTVGAGIASPGTDKHEPDCVNASRKDPCLIDIGQHHRHIEYAEKCRHDLLGIVFRIGEHQHCHLADQVRHEKHHEPVELLSREKRLKIQERIVEHRERIAHDPRRLFLDCKHLVQLCHADQADGEQHQEQEISSCDHRHESNDHQ